MSRRKGQCPKLEVSNGKYTFRYRIDVPGSEDREQRREVIGPVEHMTKSQAQRKMLEFISNLKVNSSDYQLPSSKTFAHAVKHYRESFAPQMLRPSTFDVADGHIRNHLEADWKDVPVDLIDMDAVNDWAWKKRKQGLSWTQTKNVLRTMQRVLSCFSKDKRPPFSLNGLTIPDREKLAIQVGRRKRVRFTWAETLRIADAVMQLPKLDEARRDGYAMLFKLASASGLRCAEMFALRLDDIDFEASTIRVDESADQRTYVIGPCKNAAAYRTVLLVDREGEEVMRLLREYIERDAKRCEAKRPKRRNPHSFIFHSRNGAAYRETNVLADGLHPALKSIGLARAGLHAFRHGCNRRWRLAGMNPAVRRQMMGHSSEEMAERYTGEIPVEMLRESLLGKVIVTYCDLNMKNGSVENAA